MRLFVGEHSMEKKYLYLCNPVILFFTKYKIHRNKTGDNYISGGIFRV